MICILSSEVAALESQLQMLSVAVGMRKKQLSDAQLQAQLREHGKMMVSEMKRHEEATRQSHAQLEAQLAQRDATISGLRQELESVSGSLRQLSSQHAQVESTFQHTIAQRQAQDQQQQAVLQQVEQVLQESSKRVARLESHMSQKPGCCGSRPPLDANEIPRGR